MQISILVIYETDMDGKGTRDRIAHQQIWGKDRRSKPQNWNVLCCSQLTPEALQCFRDGMFDFVLVLQAERLTQELLPLVMQKLASRRSRVVAVYEDLDAALKAPRWIAKNSLCIMAQTRDTARNSQVLALSGTRDYIESSG